MAEAPDNGPPYLWPNFEQASSNHDYARSKLTEEEREKMDRDLLELGRQFRAGLLKARATRRLGSAVPKDRPKPI